MPQVTELIIAELLYLQYESATDPIFMYINSTGVAVMRRGYVCFHSLLGACAVDREGCYVLGESMLFLCVTSLAAGGCNARHVLFTNTHPRLPPLLLSASSPSLFRRT